MTSTDTTEQITAEDAEAIQAELECSAADEDIILAPISWLRG